MDAPERPSPRFIWPPRPLPAEPSARGDEPDSSLAESPPPVGLRAPNSWVRVVETTWLDPLGGPLAQRREATGWAPDPFDEYCDRCGHDVGIHEATEFGCARCRDQRLPWQRFIRLGAYESPLSDWICEVKFNRAVRLGLQLGELLGERIRDSLSHRPFPTSQPPLVQPVPTHFLRRMTRGLDHTAVLAQGACGPLQGRVVRGLTSRRRPSQRSLSPTRRQSNVAGSMRLRAGAQARLQGRLIVLLDDVSTTGATAREAARALLAPFGGRNPASGAPTVWIATLAVTPDRLGKA